jgi:diketogulonate reductase-like aldo/keto reductase
VHRGAVPIPKSRSVDRQRENLDIFDITLSEDDLQRIGSLARADGRLADQDPAVYQEF